jgi:uncharacterized membrane protein YphA (DoxX/SURF4 family)
VFIATVVLSVLLAVVLGGAGFLKAAYLPQAGKMAEHLGITPRLTRVIGLLELSAAGGLLIGLAWAPLSIAAAIGLLVLLPLAAASHIRVKDPLTEAAPSLTLTAVTLAELILRIATI